jgi:hypothetical protein
MEQQYILTELKKVFHFNLHLANKEKIKKLVEKKKKK